MKTSKSLASPSIKASLYYATSGAFFAIATLIMARVLPPLDFGVVALAIAITNIGVAISSAGFGAVILRYPVRMDRDSLRLVFGTTAVAGIALASVAVLIYGLEVAVVLALVAAVTCGGMALVGIVPYQKAHRFTVSVPLSQVGNLALLISAGVIAGWPAARTTWLPTTIVAVAFGAVAVSAWRAHLRGPRDGEAIAGHKRDAVHFTVLSSADQLMWQLERLLIPLMLVMEDLAIFAVIGAVVIAPYHVLASSATATLVPRLQAQTTGRARRKLLLHESGILLGLSAIGGGLILLIVPPLLEWYLGPKLQVTRPLLAAAIAGGVCRILASIAASTAVAFGTSLQLGRIGIGAWLAVATGVAAAWLLSGMGLIGLIAGVALGWLARGGVVIGATWRHLSEHAPLSPTK